MTGRANGGEHTPGSTGRQPLLSQRPHRCGLPGLGENGGVVAPGSSTVIGASLAIGLIVGAGLLRRITGQSSWAISQLGWAVGFAGAAVLLAWFGHPLAALAAAAMAAFEAVLTRHAWHRNPRDLLERNRADLAGRSMPAGDEEPFVPEPTRRGYEFTVTGRRARLLGWLVTRFFRPPDPPPPG